MKTFSDGERYLTDLLFAKHASFSTKLYFSQILSDSKRLTADNDDDGISLSPVLFIIIRMCNQLFRKTMHSQHKHAKGMCTHNSQSRENVLR